MTVQGDDEYKLEKFLSWAEQHGYKMYTTSYNGPAYSGNDATHNAANSQEVIQQYLDSVEYTLNL